jgi:hypothetical protein
MLTQLLKLSKGKLDKRLWAFWVDVKSIISMMFSATASYKEWSGSAYSKELKSPALERVIPDILHPRS